MPDEDEFYDQVLSRVIRFVEYGGYGGKPRTAARAIRKRFPQLSLAECEAAFEKLLVLYEEAAALIRRNEDACWDAYKRSGRWVQIPDSLRLELADKHPDVPEGSVRGAFMDLLLAPSPVRTGAVVVERTPAGLPLRGFSVATHIIQ